MAKSFREDRDESSAAPDVHPQLEDKPSRWYGGESGPALLDSVLLTEPKRSNHPK